MLSELQKPKIVSDHTSYVKLSFLSILFPTIFPLESNGCLNPNDRRKVKTFLTKQFAGKICHFKIGCYVNIETSTNKDVSDQGFLK